ncbi:MAG TPA: hypothetical protein VIW21_06200 [Chthoniobacterales bacterium]|jgi:hypothetical protein
MSYRIARLALALSLLAQLGCAGSEPRKPAPQSFASLPAEDQQVYVALFRYMFAHWQQNPYKIPTRFYVSLRGFDAPADLLSQFKAEHYIVGPAYRYREGSGVLCSAEIINFESKSKAVVHGGYLYGSVGGEWGAFVLEKRAGFWRVISWKVEVLA